jgi:hypothetical protein
MYANLGVVTDPPLRKVYSAFAAEIRSTIDHDPSGNSDTAVNLIGACTKPYSVPVRTTNPCLSITALRGPKTVGTTADIAALPTASLFPERALGSFRSKWLDPNATWLGFKGCRGHSSHNDLDGGSFVLEVMGGSPTLRVHGISSLYLTQNILRIN